MGKIRIGRMGQKTFDSNVVKVQKPAETMSEEHKANLIESILRMPKEKWVGAFRASGLDKEADEYEMMLAEEHLREMEKKDAPEVVPSEEESVSDAEKTDDGNEEESQPVADSVVSEETVLSEEVSKPKKRGGRKKTARLK